MTRFILLFLLSFLIQSCNNNPSHEVIFSIKQDELDRLKLQYYSDYFSFIGRDKKGLVAFAIDNNRGQDQNTWQADHFVVLYDELSGWKKVQGNGLYTNEKKLLKTIPDSKYFQFRGDASNGIEMTSQINQLRLSISPIRKVIHNQQGLSHYQLGSASATLYWNDRKIEGRLIHEYLYLPAFNRLSRRYANIFDDFHGFYASVEGQGDFYLHIQKGDFFSQLTGKDDGFLVYNGKAHELKQVQGSATVRSMALGFYRWPKQWRGSFTIKNQNYDFSFSLQNKNNIANWIIGGFAMGIFSGQIKSQQNSLKVTGIAELIL